MAAVFQAEPKRCIEQLQARRRIERMDGGLTVEQVRLNAPRARLLKGTADHGIRRTVPGEIEKELGADISQWPAVSLELRLTSPVGLTRTREDLRSNWDKNNPTDAQVILHVVEIGAVQFSYDPKVVGPADIRELSNAQEIISRSETELRHRIPTR